MAIVRVQGNARGTSGSGSTSVSVTLGATPTAGNVLVLTIGIYGQVNLPSVTGISQTGVTWYYQIKSSRSTIDDEIWFGVVGSGASKSLTVSWANFGYSVADVCEYSGILTSGYLDKTATNSGQSKYSDTGTTATTTQADELWIGATASGTTQTTPTNGFTLLDGVNNVAISIAYLEKIVSATGTADSGTTMTGSISWAGCIATFKASAAPPPAGWTKLQYLTEPPTVGAFNKLKYAAEPPVSGAWNKLLYVGE